MKFDRNQPLNGLGFGVMRKGCKPAMRNIHRKLYMSAKTKVFSDQRPNVMAVSSFYKLEMYLKEYKKQEY